MPRPEGSADLLEDRRRRALALLDDGLSLNQVGWQIGCNPSSVMRWRDARRHGGLDALQVRFSPGRPLKLVVAERKRVWSACCSMDRWRRITGPICGPRRALPRWSEREFGVRYHRDHIGRLMHSLGWSPQKPERRTLERNETEINTGWKKTVQILKEGCAVGPHIVFADESGFQLIPSVVRAWVRRGKLPSFVPSSVPSATFAPRGGRVSTAQFWQCELFFCIRSLHSLCSTE